MAKGRVTVDEGRCKGCGLCVAHCPKGVLALDTARIGGRGYHPAFAAKPEECIGCAVCGLICPDVAITVERGED